MIIREKTVKAIKLIVIVTIVLIILIIILSELDRCRYRNVRPNLKMYYGSSGWITGPFNKFIGCTTTSCEDLEPFPDMVSNFPDCDMLRDNWKEIRDEVMDLYSDGAMKKIKGDLFFRKIADDNWKKFYIKWYDKIQDDAYDKLPYTCSLIDKIPQVQSAMISVLEPGAVITPHVGPGRMSLRYHLGLSTPQESDGCKITVDGIDYCWKDGEDVLFDDTFVHEVRNDTDETRIILFCDVRRNLNSKFNNWFNDKLCRVARVTGKKRKN